MVYGVPSPTVTTATTCTLHVSCTKVHVYMCIYNLKAYDYCCPNTNRHVNVILLYMYMYSTYLCTL